MKVLFLDCDGVLNCQSSWPHDSPTNTPLDKDKVELLNEITSSTGALIVMSSTWRKFIFSEVGHKDCRGILRDGGVTGEFHEDWRTPIKIESGARGREIAEWLNTHSEVQQYAIVDDDSDMLPSQMPKFVRTSWKKGMQYEHANRLVNILGKLP